VVTLKLNRANHTLLSRRLSLRSPPHLADGIYRTARELCEQAGEHGPYRLLGIGLSDLTHEDEADVSGDLLDPGAGKRSQAERATDAIRERFGKDAIKKGRALR
jgi:DNA polymerase-4